MNKYMKIFSVILCLLLASLAFAFYQYQTPRIFRQGDDIIAVKRLTSPQCLSHALSHFGKTERVSLNVTGSGFLNLDDLDAFIAQKAISKDKIYIINLHDAPIYYIGAHALDSYGYKMVDGKLQKGKLTSFFKRLFTRMEIFLYEIQSGKKIDSLTKEDLMTEKEAIQALGFQYLEPLKEGWTRDWYYINDLLKLFESIPEDGWIYFHCERGRGRTTSLLLLYDIFKNAKNLSLEEILRHQYCIGGEDIENTQIWKNGTWSQDELNDRKDLIHEFYDYMNDPKGYPQTDFIQWQGLKRS